MPDGITIETQDDAFTITQAPEGDNTVSTEFTLDIDPDNGLVSLWEKGGVNSRPRETEKTLWGILAKAVQGFPGLPTLEE